MAYVWIFVGCYAVAFIIINMKMSAQTANVEARLAELGGSRDQLRANMRLEMPLWKEFFIRAWAPFVFSIIPTGVLSLGYFIFS